MLKVLSREDHGLLKEFFPSNYPLEELLNPVHGTRFLCANVEKKITSLMIVNLIKNQYYMTIQKGRAEKEEIFSLLQFTLNVLRQDDAGIYCLYDNGPFNQEMDEILKENGFLYETINYEHTPILNQLYNVSSKVQINDRREDVLNYVMKKRKEENFSLEHANVVVARDKEERVVGVARFALITNKIIVSILYGENDEIMTDLLHLIMNLTNRPIEISLSKEGMDLGSLLEKVGFVKSQADYRMNLRG